MKMRMVSIEEENRLIDEYPTGEFYDVMREEFGPAGLVKILGYAALFGLTLQRDVVEAREMLVSLGWSRSGVFFMYGEFRRLRRALLARRGVLMLEQRGGPGTNEGVFQVVARVQRLKDLTSLNS